MLFWSGASMAGFHIDMLSACCRIASFSGCVSLSSFPRAWANQCGHLETPEAVLPRYIAASGPTGDQFTQRQTDTAQRDEMSMGNGRYNIRACLSVSTTGPGYFLAEGAKAF